MKIKEVTGNLTKKMNKFILPFVMLNSLRLMNNPKTISIIIVILITMIYFIDYFLSLREED